MDFASQQQNDKLTIPAIFTGWAVLFLSCIFAYLPGLDGPFVFDDFGSIGAIGSHGGVHDWNSFKAFVFGGHAGPTGRPLALLSFLIDANDWPADAWPFKRTNLIIHLINGALLGGLTGSILALLSVDKRNARRIALLSTACWLLHPFLVSTTLYAVQRMAQLSTLFMFSGLLAYLYYRSLIATRARKAYLGMSLSVLVFTFLAMISKENGILLPLLIGVIELTVLAGRQQHLAVLNRHWKIAFIIVPSTVIALYLGAKVFSGGFFEVVPPRDFSLYERVLTQPRILADYLRHWFVPELYTTGVFQDHFIKSSGVLTPMTTLLSLLLHLVVISIALIKRRKWPLFAFATLFFYASHVLESSVINLELYFEHRNYLAAAFLFLPVVVLLQKNVSGRLFFAAAAGALLLLAGFTRYSATVWADYPSMVEASARKAPTSARAQVQYSINLFNEQRHEEALQVIDRAIQLIPQDSSLLITRSMILCNMGVLAGSEFEHAASVVSANVYDARMIRMYTTLSESVADRRCPDVSMDALRSMFADMLLVSQNADPQSLQYSQIKYFIGLVNVRSGKPTLAVAAFEESLQARPGTSHAMNMAAVLASNDYFEEALYLSGIALTQLEGNSSGVMQGVRVSEHDIRAFRATVRADMNAARQDDHELPIAPSAGE